MTIFKFRPVEEEMSPKNDISCSSESHFVQRTWFGRGHYVEHSCDIILNLNKWCRRNTY